MNLQNLSSAEAKNSAEWIRKDLKKRLWNPKHQEYSRYSDYEKYKLAVLVGIDIPKRIDTKKLKAEFFRELYGEGEPVSSSITKMSSDPSKKPFKAPGDNTYYPIFKKAIAEKHNKEKSRENDNIKKEDAAKVEKVEKVEKDEKLGTDGKVEKDGKVGKDEQVGKDGKVGKDEQVGKDGKVEKEEPEVETTPDKMDNTQSNSNQGSPHLTLSSKIMAVRIRQMSNETVYKENSQRHDPMPCTLKNLLDVSEPIIEAILPHKDRYDLIDRLKLKRCRSSETNQIDEIQLRNLVNNVITATYLSVKECCEAVDVFDFPINLLVLNIEKWVQRLGYVVPEKEKKFFEEVIKSHSVGVWTYNTNRIRNAFDYLLNTV